MSTETTTRNETPRQGAVTALCQLAEELQITPREQFDGEQVSQTLWDIAHSLEYGFEAEDPETVVAAARLAMIAGATDTAKLAVVEALLATAPEAREDDTASPALLVKVLRAIGGRFEVSS